MPHKGSSHQSRFSIFSFSQKKCSKKNNVVVTDTLINIKPNGCINSGITILETVKPAP